MMLRHWLSSRLITFLRVAVPVAGILLAIVLAPTPLHIEYRAVRDGIVVIDFGTPIRTLDPLAVGMDLSGYGYPHVFVNDQVEQQKLQALGVKYLRIDLIYSLPGDPTSKIVCGGDGCDTQWTGDQWVQAIKAIGAQPLIIVPPSVVDAAQMVRHFNQEAHTPVHYWVVGNEPDLKGIDASTYSRTFNQVYDAMKAIDPTIQVGGGATSWYDRAFLQTFLQQSGSRVDFVDFHGYAQEGTAPGDPTALFHTAADYGNNINDLRSLIRQVVPARAAHIGIEVGEWDLNWGGTAQSNLNFHAVWAASVEGNILQAGGWSLFYADKGNALYGNAHTVTDPYGHVVLIQPDDTNPAYHGIGMFTGEGLFRGFGTTVVRARTTLPHVEVFASDHAKNIVVLNMDQSVAQVATFSLNGATSGSIEVWRKDESVLFPDPPVKLATLHLENGTFTYHLPPLSITTFVLH
jgi:Glycosyl hydrolases family 39